MAAWLKKCAIKSVAMESTGIYWLPVYQILEQAGFEINLINAQHIKGMPGRKKTDVEDCSWLQKLHSYGLLKASFRPADQICVLRSYIRQRARLIENASTHILRMQKSLTEMNIQLHNVISDITGTTGTDIIKAILAGERDPMALAKLRHYRIKSSEDVIAKSLVGDYREEHLFILRQEFDAYNFCRNQIADLDKAIEACYQTFDQQDNKAPLKKKQRRLTSSSNLPYFNLSESLYSLLGIDFTDIPGLSELTVQTIVSEVGTDMSKWPTEKHFTSWLGLSPTNKISGAKILSSRTRKVKNSASKAFRLAACSAGKTQTAIGAFMRRIKGRAGAPKAITATARKIACLFYRLLKYGKDYVEQGMEYYENKYKANLVGKLEKLAKRLGYDLVQKLDNQMSAADVS
jgi:transposase